MKLNEVSWNVTLTPIDLQSGEAVRRRGGKGNLSVPLKSITFCVCALKVRKLSLFMSRLEPPGSQKSILLLPRLHFQLFERYEL